MSELSDRLAMGRQRKLAAGEKLRLNPVEKAQKNPKSRTLAIAAKCYDCQGQDTDPSVNWRIGNCEIPECPLYPVRPHQKLFSTPIPVGLAKYLHLDDEIQGKTKEKHA